MFRHWGLKDTAKEMEALETGVCRHDVEDQVRRQRTGFENHCLERGGEGSNAFHEIILTIIFKGSCCNP